MGPVTGLLFPNIFGESNCDWLLLCSIHGVRFCLYYIFWSHVSISVSRYSPVDLVQQPSVGHPVRHKSPVRKPFSTSLVSCCIVILISANLIITTLHRLLKKKVWKKAQLIRFLWMAMIWHQNNLPSEPSSCCDTTMAVKPDIGPSVPKQNL